MEKELKIAELASIWGASVPTTWNRIRKEGLSTVKKLDENRKEINYVVITDEQINKYINNNNNNVNNTINNNNYEELLTIDNDNKVINNGENAQGVSLSAVEVFDRLICINNQYNERLESVNKELVEAKSKQLLLEDKANREGFYLNEIKELKTDNNRLSRLLTTLIIVSMFLLLCLVGVLTYNFAINTKTETEQPEQEQIAPAPIEEVTQNQNLSPTATKTTPRR